MARKVNPFIIRLGLNRNWNSIWYIKKNNFSNYLIEDLIIRNYLEKFFKNKPIGKIIVLKNLKFLNLIFYIKKFSYISKTDIFSIRKNISIFTQKTIYLKFKNILNSNLDSKLMVFYIKKYIELNRSYKTIIKNVINSAFKSRCLGLKILIKGRINGNIMTRKQVFCHGKIPLQKFCSNIKYYSDTAHTKHGCIGLKIWIYLGDLMY